LENGGKALLLLNSLEVSEGLWRKLEDFGEQVFDLLLLALVRCFEGRFLDCL
jgi:hypothetical protein